MTTLTIDKKVSIGIIWAILGSVVGGVVYMANLNSNLLVATDTLREVKTAIEKNTAQIVKSDRSVAVLESMTMAMDRRISELEKATKR
jgi:hypothetical protein